MRTTTCFLEPWVTDNCHRFQWKINSSCSGDSTITTIKTRHQKSSISFANIDHFQIYTSCSGDSLSPQVLNQKIRLFLPFITYNKNKTTNICLLSISFANIDHFQIYFTSTVNRKFATKRSLKILQHLKWIATLPHGE